MNLRISKPKPGRTLYKTASCSIHGPIPTQLPLCPWIPQFILMGEMATGVKISTERGFGLVRNDIAYLLGISVP